MYKILRTLSLLFLLSFAMPMATAVYAQEEAAEEATEDAGEGTSLIGMYKTGGWAMYPLTLMSMAAVGLIIYNFLALRPKTFLRTDLVEQVDGALAQLDVEGAITICDENPCPVTTIIGAGLKRVTEELDAEAIEKGMEESSSQEFAAPFVLVNYLNVVATLAPMVGLLGTVSGMVKAFNVIATQGTGDPKVLAGNISEALITTASGMLVGIPAMFFYFFFKNKFGSIITSANSIIGDTLFNFMNSVRTGGVAGEEEYEEGEVEEEVAEEEEAAE